MEVPTMATIINLMCPHCRLTQYGRIDLNNCKRPKLVICDTAQGGCDREFVIRFALTVAVTSHEIGGKARISILDHTDEKREKLNRERDK